MNLDEWSKLARAVNADISAMTRAAQTQSEVRAILDHRRVTQTEEQFIDEDAFDNRPAEPRVFQIGNANVKVWKVHRLGLDLSDVKGADLYYELEDRKFILVQYKTPSASNRVVLDDQQLRDLQDACPVKCLPTSRFNCGSWYALRNAEEHKYFPACEVREIFSQYASRKAEYFVNGLTKAQFQQDFGICRIGARVNLIDLNSYKTSSIENDRVMFYVENNGFHPRRLTKRSKRTK